MPEIADPSLRRIDLVGVLTIDRAASLKTEFLEAVEAARSLILDVSRLEDIDLSCLQLIYAARRACRASGKNLHLTGPLNRHVAARLVAAGFTAESPGTAEALEAALVDF